MKICSKCNSNIDRDNQRYCKVCHAEYMRKWRKTYKMTKQQQIKDSCRSYAGVYKRRKKIDVESCEICKKKEVEMHHDDYTKPLLIRFLCRKHHIELHRKCKGKIFCY